MPLLRIQHHQANMLSQHPEHAMGVHLVNCPLGGGVVIGAVVLMILDDAAIRQVSDLLELKWFAEQTNDTESTDGFSEWLGKLGEAPSVEISTSTERLRVVLSVFPISRIPSTAVLSTSGHLPFTRKSRANDVFYRCEHWPTSRRINQGTGVIAPGTFAFPSSEIPFVPSGFAAVGRYALPSLPPACRRYELQPPAHTRFRCGASVPLHGQSGGGVEVEFRKGFTNRGPIANPIILPAL